MPHSWRPTASGSHPRRSPHRPWSRTSGISWVSHLNRVGSILIDVSENKRPESHLFPYFPRSNGQAHLFSGLYRSLRTLQGTLGWPSAPSTWQHPRQCPAKVHKVQVSVLRKNLEMRGGKFKPRKLGQKTSPMCLLADVAWRWSLPEPGVALEALRSEVTMEELHDELRQHGALGGSTAECYGTFRCGLNPKFVYHIIRN